MSVSGEQTEPFPSQGVEKPERRPVPSSVESISGEPGAGEAQIEEWVKAAQGGDKESFRCLIEHFQDRVWRRALYRLKDHEEAYDVSQEVLILCFRKIHQFRGESKFWTWLCRIVDNQVKNREGWLHRRGKGRTFSLDTGAGRDDDEAPAWDPPDPGPGPRREAAGREMMEALNRNLDRLSADHREVLLLRFADEFSYEEIAETLDVSLGTVKSRINRARSELRVLMADHLE